MLQHVIEAIFSQMSADQGRDAVKMSGQVLEFGPSRLDTGVAVGVHLVLTGRPLRRTQRRANLEERFNGSIRRDTERSS